VKEIPGMDKKLLGKRIGALVRQRRKDLQLTQEDLEAASGIPQGTISRIECEVAEDIHVSTLLGLAEALDMTASDILTLASSPAQETAKATAPKRVRRPAKAAKD
jgi:transcriptional regulator with XRE-family HTH domain